MYRHCSGEEGKRLRHFTSNLFRKWCAKFRQNRPSFVGDAKIKHLGFFFLDAVYTRLCSRKHTQIKHASFHTQLQEVNVQAAPFLISALRRELVASPYSTNTNTPL